MTEDEQEPGRRGDALGIGAVASFVLSGLAIEKLSQSLDAGGWIGRIGIGVTAVLAVSWLVVNAPFWWRRLRRRRTPASAPPADELRVLAEQAEHWLVALGTDANGMAAAEWFELHEGSLRAMLADESRTGGTDELAAIADALEAWYVRRRRGSDLLELSDRLAAVAERTGRRDLEEIALVRACTAYRLMDDPATATSRLGVAANVAPHGRTSAAMTTRRHVERALLNLAEADRRAPGSDRNEAVLNARDRLTDARLRRPGPDHAADLAIMIDLGIVYLYLQDPEQALEHLRVAVARADAAADASAHAHAKELTGIAAWMLRNPHQAIAWWTQAERLYADVDELEGRARCLQHLGSAAWADGRHGDAVEQLERSALLRGGTEGHEILGHYLAVVRGDLATAEPPPIEVPARLDLVARVRVRIRRAIVRWRQ